MEQLEKKQICGNCDNGVEAEPRTSKDLEEDEIEFECKITHRPKKFDSECDIDNWKPRED